MKKFFTTLIVLCFAMGISYAQGVLSGTIVDATGPLPGVSVYLKGTTQGNITDADGRFVIGNLPTGSQTFVISFIGYETLEKQVEVGEGSNNLGSISLSESSTALEEVVVTSTLRQGQMKALNIQKNSPNIMAVLASDAIGKLPDRNAAEAVQRISGVAIERDQGEGRFVLVRGTPIQWSSTLINGDRMPSTRSGDRGVPLDIFPSELIQYVQLSKAITPDMEGDAIGGSVNFITRTSPQEKMLNASFAGGYHGQSQSRIYNGSIIFGDRILDNKLGYIFSAATWNRDWGSDNFEVDYNTAATPEEGKFAMNELQLRDYVGNRTTWGFNGGLDYEFNPQSKVYLKGIWTDFLDDEERRRTRFRFNNGRIEHALTHTLYHSRFRGMELGGEQKLADRLKVDWKASSYATRFWYDSPAFTGGDRPGLFAKAGPQSSEDRGYYFSTFRQSGVEFDGLSSDGRMYFDFDRPDGSQTDNLNIRPSVSANTPMTTESAEFREAAASGRWLRERDVTGKLDFTYEASGSVNLKFGGKYRSKDRLVNRSYTFYNPTGDVFMNEFASEPFPADGGFLSEIDGVYDDFLVDYPTLDANDNIPNRSDIEKEFQPFDGPDRAPDSYRATENISAFYGMAEFKLNTKLTLLGGARYENTDIDYDGYSVNEETEEVAPINAKRSFGAFLPMAHLKYSPSNNTNLRLAITRTFARPDFASLSPSRSLNFGENSGEIGNPDLQPTFSWNFDVLGEHYFDNVGVIAAGVFYKDITDAIFDSNSQTVIDGMNFLVSTPENASDAYLVGFEIGIVRRLDFLPGFASGFGIDANYTFTDSEVQVPGRDEKQQLFGQSKHIWNATLFYEKYGLMVRLAANFKGSYLASLQGSGPDQDRFYDKNLNLDFSTAYSVTPKVRAFVELNNLLNEPLRYYHGDVNRPEQVEWYSIRGQAGITISM